MDAQETPAGGRTCVGMRLIDERPDIADRMIPGNWEGDLTSSKRGPGSRAQPLVELPNKSALPLGLGADGSVMRCPPHQGLPERSDAFADMGPGREMAATSATDTGVEVFQLAHHSPWERGTSKNTNRLIRATFPKELSPATSPTSTPSPTN